MTTWDVILRRCTNHETGESTVLESCTIRTSDPEALRKIMNLACWPSGLKLEMTQDPWPDD